MRKLLLPGLLLMALFVACENKNPAGPGSVGPGGVTVSETTTSTSTTTTTSTIPATTTTSTTSTTTTVTGNLARRYVAFQAPPNVPADMTLFFQLLTGGLSLTSILDGLPFVGAGPEAIDNKYKVTGIYLMGNGANGTVQGELTGGSNPLETGGTFSGTLVLNASGCTAEREFGGELTAQTLRWGGGSILRECAGSPLSFQSFSMVRSDAPLPSTTTIPATTTVPTTSSTSTSTTTSTTTAVSCTYTLAPTSGTAPAEGGTGQVVIGTLPTCAWTAQSFASWLTVAPASGAGPASVTYTAAPNVNGPARTGTLVIAGLTFSVTQAAPPPPDLIPVLPVSTSSCGFSSGQFTVTAQATNAGIGPSVVNSAARITFVTGASTTPDQNVGPLAVKAQTPLTFVLPTTCFSDGVCNFTIALDATGTVFESNEANNTVTSSCSSGSVGLAGRGSRPSPQ